MKIYCDGSTTRVCFVTGDKPQRVHLIDLPTKTTNNQGEYLAIIEALEWATAQGIREVKILSDSELAIKQLRVEYAIKDNELAKLARQVWKYLDHMDITFVWIPREDNPAGRVLG